MGNAGTAGSNSQNAMLATSDQMGTQAKVSKGVKGAEMNLESSSLMQ